MNDKLDVKTINKMLLIGKYLLIIAAIYVTTLVFSSWHIAEFLGTIISTLAPILVGLFIAWLFDPLVDYLVKKGFKRFWASLLIYLVFISVLVLVVCSIVPLVGNQLTEVSKMIPSLTANIKSWIENVLNAMNIGNTAELEKNIFSQIENISKNMTSSLPSVSINVLSSFFSTLSSFVIGIIIGFFILVSFGNSTNIMVNFLPKKWRKDAKVLIGEIVTSFRNFLKGAVIDSTLIFIVTSILLWLVGLKEPLLFGLFCAITNVIPYAGPYIGGFPAVLIGFSQSPIIGISVLIVIIAIQFIEGNFFQPLIMSYSTKLHPVTIIAGLLIFGHFFGIIGMFISTPVIAALKTVFVYFDNKYNFFNY